MIHSKDYVTGIDKECIQPNAVDLRIESIRTLVRGLSVTIGGGRPKEFVERRSDGVPSSHGDCFLLLPGTSYDVMVKHSVKIPEGMCGWIIGRSTFVRNGIVFQSGLYDSGFDNQIGFVIHNMGPCAIKTFVGERIAQFVMAQAETAHLYQGTYNTNNQSVQ